MTMRTYTYFICKNGHLGHEKFSENDQPYSKMWESITTEGLDEVTGTDSKKRYVCSTCKEPVTRTEKPKCSRTS